MPHEIPFRPRPAVLFIVEHLPDSIRLRKELLKDCLSLLAEHPEDDFMKRRVQQLLDILEIHELLQAELPLHFPEVGEGNV
jgi:hypothetical protein